MVLCNRDKTDLISQLSTLPNSTKSMKNLESESENFRINSSPPPKDAQLSKTKFNCWMHICLNKAIKTNSLNWIKSWTKKINNCCHNLKINTEELLSCREILERKRPTLSEIDWRQAGIWPKSKILKKKLLLWPRTTKNYTISSKESTWSMRNNYRR